MNTQYCFSDKVTALTITITKVSKMSYHKHFNSIYVYTEGSTHAESTVYKKKLLNRVRKS